MNIVEFDIYRDIYEFCAGYNPLEFDPNDPYIDEFDPLYGETDGEDE